jgi:hypothetical protein
MKSSAKTECLDLPGRIARTLELAQHRPYLFAPKALEFQICALLAAWEAITLRDSNSCHWLKLWQERCRKVHRDHPGLTLADAVVAPESNRPRASDRNITAKAHQSVLDGLRRVYKGVLSEYDNLAIDDLTAKDRTAQILAELLTKFFRTGKSFAPPEALETFLLTLIELFESALGPVNSSRHAVALWRREIQKKRSLGPAAQRTLAEVVPFDLRPQDAKQRDPRARESTVIQVVKSMLRVVRILDAYLVQRHRRAN